jgi:UTP-glucose-1-phosphate uridylyltransferase
MLPVASKPLIQYAFEEAVKAGIEQFIFVTGRNKSAINNHFDYSYELQEELSRNDKKLELELTKDWLPAPGQIVFLRQQKPLGLGHAVMCAKDIVGNEPCAIILADEMLKCQEGFLKRMVDYYNIHGGNIIGVSKVNKEDTSKYGIIVPEYKGSDISVRGMVEKPAPEDAPSDLSIEIQLTDAMQKMISIDNFHALQFEGDRFDCGSQGGFLEANIAYSLDNKAIASEVVKFLGKYVRA